MKKILIIGQNLNLGSTEEVYGRGFSSFEVEYFTWQQNLPNLSLVNKLARRLAWQPLAQIANAKLLTFAKQWKPDLTLVVSPLLLQPSTIFALKEYGKVFVFFTDNPLDGHHTHSNAWVREGFALWDAVFIWSQQLVSKLEKNGVKRAYFHPFCADTHYHFPLSQKDPSYDVAFIGNWDGSRKREYYLKALEGYRLGLWGTDYWQTRCQETSLKGLYQGNCSYQDIPKILGSAKIGLNILRPQNEGGHNIRTYEIPATATLMLSERSQTLLDLFIEDREAVYFSTPEELKQKVSYLLQNPTLAQSIARSGYEKALSNTITERIAEILKIYQDQ